MPAPPYQEIKPSPQPEWYVDGKDRLQCRAVRYMKCTWANRRALMEWLMTQAGGSYPHDDGTPYALARRIKSIPRGRTQGIPTLISHDECIVEVRYDTYGPQWVNSQYVEETLGRRAFRVYPPGNMYWDEGPPDGIKVTSDEARRGIPVIGSTHKLKIGRATTTPSDAMAYIGMCNTGIKETFTLGYSFPPQTVLYVPPFVGSHSDYSLGTRYTVVYEHIINPHGWNKYWRTSTGAWEYLYNADGEIYVQYPATW